MKNNKTTILVFTLLVVASALYRVWDNRPLGFAPQIAMALFAGSVIKNKRISFLIPILSMLVSDGLYQLLYQQGLSSVSDRHLLGGDDLLECVLLVDGGDDEKHGDFFQFAANPVVRSTAAT